MVDTNNKKYCIFEKKLCTYANKVGNVFDCKAPNDEDMTCNPNKVEKEYVEGQSYPVSDVKRDFVFDNRNDFLKKEAFYSLDGRFVAVIYDDSDFVEIQRA